MRAHLIALTILVGLLAGVGPCPPEEPPGQGGDPGPPLPFARTEEREACAHFDPLKQPFFGETHIHTAVSADAVINGTTNGPREAYAFSQGAEIELTTATPGRKLTIDRPLDFAMVSDHAEYFGETAHCVDPNSVGYLQPHCVALRADIGATSFQVPGILVFYFPSLTPFAQRFDWCGTDGSICLNAAAGVWQDMQAAAEEAYDRSSECRFTTFHGYEWTSNLARNNLHRNVIFRNDDVPALPVTAIEAPFQESLWAGLQTECRDGLSRCEALAIPHNSNLSGGVMFAPVNEDDGTLLSAADAIVRAANEPVVEIYQHKGESECHPGLSVNDELCGFEKLDATNQGVSPPGTVPPPANMVRNVLMEGLAQAEQLGVNPFQMGFIAATDFHMANSGATREEDFAFSGGVGSFDADPAQRLQLRSAFGNQAGSGGLAVAWAEENSRDSIYAAFERREVYATSGTRPVVRTFGGFRIRPNMCERADFALEGYDIAVPMGGSFEPPPDVAGKHRTPKIAVLAHQDPGPAGEPGTQLQRIQIVKGWVDASGQTQEATYDVAGDPNNGASVDLETCEPQGAGFASLCTVWEDPDFDPAERAFYYARVVENPTCRWNTHLCNAQGVDCSDPNGVPTGFEACCDGSLPATIQERAWTSPIWYEPGP